MDVRKVMTSCGVYGIAEIHCKRHGLPTEATLDEGIVNPQAIQFVACRDPEAVKTKHSAKQVDIFYASGGCSYFAKIGLNFLCVEENNGVCPVIAVFTDGFMCGKSEALCATTYSPGGTDWAPRGVCVIPPEGDDLTVIAILLPAPLYVNTEEAGGLT
jgi:hypothetical protein